MHARVSTLQVDASKIDDVTRQLEEQDVPNLESTDGFKGLTVLADRSSGKTVAVSFWESEEALSASEEAGQQARQRAAEAGGAAGEPQVERYEVVLDTMA